MLVNTDNLSAFLDAHENDVGNLATNLGLFNFSKMKETSHQQRDDAANFSTSDNQKIGEAAEGILKAIYWADKHWADPILTRPIKWDTHDVAGMIKLADEIWDDIKEDTHLKD